MNKCSRQLEESSKRTKFRIQNKRIRNDVAKDNLCKRNKTASYHWHILSFRNYEQKASMHMKKFLFRHTNSSSFFLVSPKLKTFCSFAKKTHKLETRAEKTFRGKHHLIRILQQIRHVKLFWENSCFFSINPYIFRKKFDFFERSRKIYSVSCILQQICNNLINKTFHNQKRERTSVTWMQLANNWQNANRLRKRIWLNIVNDMPWVIEHPKNSQNHFVTQNLTNSRAFTNTDINFSNLLKSIF